MIKTLFQAMAKIQVIKIINNLKIKVIRFKNKKLIN